MKIESPHLRLASFWGKVDQEHNMHIARHVQGSDVLDIGCGYGSLAAHLSTEGYSVLGIDNDKDSIRIAHSLFPLVSIQEKSLQNLDSRQFFDTVTMKDTFHHLYGESDIHDCMRLVKRFLRPGGRLIILDPNPCLLVRICRRIARHVDEEAPAAVVPIVLRQHGFKIISSSFFETIALPLSGGYVGPNLVPEFEVVHRLVLAGNHVIERMARLFALENHLCWRYLFVAELPRNLSDGGLSPSTSSPV